MNKVTGGVPLLIGNVGATPEIKTVANGTKVGNFSLATSEKYTDKAGKKVELTEWHRTEVWNGLANVAENIIKKGDRICIEGKIRNEKWEDKDGKSRTTVKIRVERIELLGKRREEVEQEAEAQAEKDPKGTKKPTKAKIAFEASTDDKDGLPF